MADLKFSKVKLSLDGKQVELSLDQIRKKAEQTATAMKGMKPDSAEWKQARKNLEALHAAEEDMIPTLERVNHYMKEMAHTATTDLGKATRELTKLRDAMPGDHKDLAKINGFIEKFKDWMKQNREMGMTLEKAKAQLSDLVNTPTAKLEQGLAAINKELATNAKLSDVDKAVLRSGAKNYEAQIALNKLGPIPTWNPNTSGLNVDQLKQEYSRLQQAYSAVSRGPEYGAEATQIHNQMQAITAEIQRQAEAERQLMAEQQKAAQVTDVLTRVNQQQKVTLDELRTAEKNLQDQIARMEGQNLPFADQNKLLQAKASLQDIQETISHITLDSIDFDSLENEPVERLEKLLKQLEADEKRLAATDKQASEQMAANKRKVQQAIQRVKNQTLDLADAQKVANERGKHSAQDMQRAYDTLKQHLATLSTSQRKEISETRQQMKQLKADIESVTGAVSNQNSIWKTAVRNITAYVGVFGAFNFIKNKITEVIRGGAELSDQMAKIRMVSGLAMEEIEDLTRSLAKLDTRTTLTELNELAYIGSKLGFGEMGVGALEDFAKAANQVNVALKEDLGNEAMTALSKITENMGLIKKMGVEQALLSTSSAMFKLFTSSTAAAGPIVEVTKRLAPMAQISGFATHEILALASASDALMQSEEVAGTAMSKFMMAMQNNHNVIEKTLGMTEGSIATMMKSGKSMEAFLTILDKMSGKNVTELQNVWKLLGSEGDRLIRVILAMANHTELVRQHLDTSAKAFKEATAVTEEYNIQQETAAAYLERANNKIRNAFINPDSSLAVKEMTKAWYDFVKSITDSDLALSSILTSINALLLAIRALIALLPGITFGLMAKGARMLYDNMKLANIATEGFITSWKKMDAATKSNWIGLIVGSLIQAVYWIKQFSSSTSDAEKEQKKLNDAIENMHEKADTEIKSLDRLKKQLDDTNISQEERNALLSKVRKDYDIYLNYLGIEKNKVVDLTKHYDALVKVMKQRFAYQEREDYKRDVMGGEDGIRMQRRKASASLKKQATDMGIKELDVDTEVMPLLRQGWSVDQVMDVIAPDLKRAADNISKSESAARTFAGPGAAVGKRSNQNQKYLDLKSSFQKFADAVQREQKMEADIDAAFASEIGDFDYDKWLRTQVMGEFKLKPDKEALRAAKKAAQERKKALKLEMDEAQKASTGIISKLEEYYRLQEAAINDARADGQLTEEQAKEMVRALSIVKNESLATARRAVTTGETKDWDELKTKVLPAVMSDTSEVSRNLLSTIQQVAVDKLHNDLQKFNGGKDVMGLDSRAFFDQMNAKAAGNTREAARLKAKLFTQAETMVKQYRIFDQAVDKMRDDVEQMGFITETYEEFAERMRLGIEKKPDNIIKLSGSQRQARQQMTDRFNATQGISAEKPQDMGEWFKEFTDNGKEEWMRALPELQKWVMDTDKYKDQINNLYELLKKVQRGESIQMTAEQLAPTNTQIDEAVSTHISDKEAYAAMGFKFLGQGTIPYRINIENEEEALEWMRQFGTTASGELEVWAQAIPELEKWVTLLQRKAELQKEGKDLTADELAELQNAIPQIQALYYKMNEFSDKVPEAISKQVQQMTGRKPIGIAERGEQHAAQVDLTTQLYDNKINEARSSGNEDAALELEEQKKQALIDLERQYQQELWQIREQMGVNVFEQYENEVAMYKNMLDKKLITEKQFQQKKGQLQMKLGLDVAQQYNNMMSNMVNALQEAEIASVEAKYDAEINAAKAAGQDTTALEEQKEAEIYEIRKKYAGMQLAVKISEIIANTAVAIMMAYAQLGPIAGSVAAAMLGVTGAAQLALAIAEYNKVMAASAGGSSKASSTGNATKTKLVSGMLTYDKGNVQRFVGQDGKVYTATAEPAPKDGLVTHPIATTVQGQPALVAENGPEIVIGRKTTANIMRNAPELLQAIVDIDKNPHKKPDALPTYDKGNVSEVAGEAKAAENSEKVQEVTMRVNRDNRYHTERQDERNNEEQSVAMSEESLQRMMEQFRKTRISHEATNKHRRQQEDSRKESMRRDSVTTDAKDSTESLTRWFRDFATAEMTTQYVTLGEWAKAPESHIGEIKQLYKVLSSHDEQTRRSDQQAIERTMDTINNVKDITSVKTESENTVVSEEALSKMTAKFRTIEEQRRLDTNDTAAVTRWLNDFVTTDVTSMEDVRSQKEDVTKKSAVSSKKSDVQDTSTISRQTSDIKNREVREQFVKSMPAVEQWQTEPEKHVSEILQLYNTLATHDEQMRRSEQEHTERSIATVNDVMSIIGMKTDATSTDRQQSVKITEDIATEMVRKHRQVEEQRRQREEQEQKRVKDATSWLRDFVTTDVTSLEDVRSQKEDVTKKSAVSSKKSDIQDTLTVSRQTSDIKNREVRESFTKAMPHVDEWLKEPEKHVEEIMQLRSMLTRYDEQLQRSEVENAEHNEVDSKQRIARSISDNIDRNETAAFSDEVLNQMVSKHRSINEQRRLREELEQKRSSVDERSRSDVQDVRRTFDKGNVEEVTKRRRLDTSNTEEMTRWLNDFVTTDVTSLEDVRSQKEDVTKKSAVSSKKSDIQDTSTVSHQTSDIKNREVRESFTKAMPHVDEWLQDPEKHQQEIAKLYTTLTDIDERERISREESSRMDDRRTDSATVRRDSVTTDKNIALTEQYYKGEDGRTYKAQPGAVPEGVTLLTKPIATMINGEPSLVAEKGLELVIGRETTKAMQLNRPDLLRAIVSFDKNKTQQSMRMFDQGNIQSIGADTPETPVSDANEERQALRQQMTQMQDVMNGVLYYLQHPVRPKIDMYSHGGEDGLYDSMKKATKFMSRYGG